MYVICIHNSTKSVISASGPGLRMMEPVVGKKTVSWETDEDSRSSSEDEIKITRKSKRARCKQPKVVELGRMVLNKSKKRIRNSVSPNTYQPFQLPGQLIKLE